MAILRIREISCLGLAFLHGDFNLLLFDFRYLGQSEGSYSTAGAKEVEDLLAAVQFLKTRGVKEVGVWGFSMGGAVALMAIEKAPEIKAVIAESSYANLAHMALELFRIPLVNYPIAYLVGLWAKLFLGIDLSDVSPAERVRHTSVPILLIHSSADAVIPFSHAQSLQAALKNNPRAEFWFHEGIAHGQLAADYQSRVRNFFHKNLQERLLQNPEPAEERASELAGSSCQSSLTPAQPRSRISSPRSRRQSRRSIQRWLAALSHLTSARVQRLHE